MSVSFAEEDNYEHLPAIVSPSRLMGNDDERGSVGEESFEADGYREENEASVARPHHIGALLDKINDKFGHGEDREFRKSRKYQYIRGE